MLAVSPTCPQHKTSANVSVNLPITSYNAALKTDRQTESDAYELTVKLAQVGLKNEQCWNEANENSNVDPALALKK